MAIHYDDPILFSGKPTVSRQWYLDLPQQFEPDYIRFWDDFTGVTLDATNDWTVIKDSSAAVALVADTVGGWVSLASQATTDDDGSSIQGNEIFLPAAGKNIWFKARIQSEDTGSAVTEQDVCVGLVVNFATNPEAMLTAADRICFQIDDGNASILCKTEASNVETSTDSQVDIVDATAIELGFVIKGTSAVEFYVNDALVATHTTNIPATEMTPAVMQLSGSTSDTKKVFVDYVQVVANR